MVPGRTDTLPDMGSSFTAARMVRWVPALALVIGSALLVPASDAARGPHLNVTPTQAAPGEILTLTGSLPTKVRRPIVVQRRMGNSYLVVAHGRTNAKGRFHLRIHKNGMPSDPYRVFARTVRVHHKVYRAIHTPVRVVKTLEPDVEATLSTDSVGVGGRATLTAAATPVRPGRPLTLQVRTSPTTWQTIGSSVPENTRGQATFVLDTSAPGTRTYRVRAEAWNGAGWFPSFPETLSVGGAPRAVVPADTWQGQVAAARKAAAQPGPVNAANTFKWGPMAERWEWEAGESTDPWQIYADGTGRATIYTAMMTLDSGPFGGRSGYSAGTVKATLQNSGHTYGRWEARVRAPSFQTGGADYSMALNLVPTCATAATACTSPSVDLGSWTGYSSATSIGVCEGTTAWRTTRSLSHNRENWHTLGVEVTPKRIVWFLDAKVTAVLNNPGAVPGVPLVPQLVLQGKPGAAMNHTRLTADWVRYFTLKFPNKGKIAGAAPTASTVSGC